MDRQEKQRLDEYIEGVYADAGENYLRTAQYHFDRGGDCDGQEQGEYALKVAQAAATIAVAQAAERQAVAMEALVVQGATKPATDTLSLTPAR